MSEFISTVSNIINQIGFGRILIVAAILIVAIIVAIVSRSLRLKNYRQTMVELQNRLNGISTQPIQYHLGRAESIIKNMPDMQEEYKGYQQEHEDLKNYEKEEIEPLVNTLDEQLFYGRTKNVSKKISELQNKIDSLETKTNDLMSRIQKITEIENKQRVEIIRVKEKYRELTNSYQTMRYKIEGYVPNIIQIFIEIDDDFVKLENLMNNQYFQDAQEFTKEIDGDIDQLASDVKNLPSYITVVKQMMPSKIGEIETLISMLSEDKYAMKELKTDERYEEIKTELDESIALVKDVKISDAGKKLEVLTDHIEELAGDLTKERESYLQFRDKWKKCNDLIASTDSAYKECMVDYNRLQSLYVIDDTEVTIASTYAEFLDTLDEFHMIEKKLESGEFAYASTLENIDSLNLRMNQHNDCIKEFITQRDAMYMQEQRASDELENINIVLLEIKSEIKNKHLPMINESYKDYIKDSYVKAREIQDIRSKRPIQLEELSNKVDGARDVIYNLYDNVHNLVVTADMVEEAIVYGNRYRSSFVEVNTELTKAEVLYRNGEYTKALSTAIDIIEKIKPGSYEKLIKQNESEAKSAT